MLALNRFNTWFQCFYCCIKEVNVHWVEGSTILVGNDVLPRQLQLKHFCKMLANCMMLKIRAITKNCRCVELTDTLNT